jgi:hypothetical protein
LNGDGDVEKVVGEGFELGDDTGGQKNQVVEEEEKQLV